MSTYLCLKIGLQDGISFSKKDYKTGHLSWTPMISAQCLIIAVVIFIPPIIAKVYILCKHTLQIHIHYEKVNKIYYFVKLYFCLACIAMLLIQKLYYDFTLISPVAV